MSILKNPFFLREWWVWKREMPIGKLSGLRAAFAGILTAPFILAYLSGLLIDTSYCIDFQRTAWMIAGGGWLLLLSVVGVLSTAQIYQQEKDQGTLQVASLTAVKPLQEASGRWAGALIPLAEGWLMGLLLVLISPLIFLPFHGAGGNLIQCLIRFSFMWIFAGLWCCALAALGLACSAASRTAVSAVVGTISAVIIIPIVTIGAVGWLAGGTCYRGAMPLVMSLATLLPPNPVCLAKIYHGLPAMAPLAAIPFWILFVQVVIGVAAFFIAGGSPLRLTAEAQPGPRGLMPSNPERGAGVADTNTPWNDISAVPSKDGPPSRPEPPRKSWLADLLLGRFDGNPFYMAYRRGFARLFSGSIAAPGSAVPPGLMICGLFTTGVMSLTGTPSAVPLLVSIAAAGFISACEGFAIGMRALQAERDRSTWPLLLVTGMRPNRVLEGKFAAAFYALSGEWTFTIPLWLFAAIPGCRLWLLTLAIIHPGVTALSILAGLWFASQPRFLLIRIRSLLFKILAIVSIWFVADRAIPGFHVPLLRVMAEFLNPYRVFEGLIAPADGLTVMQSLLTGGLQALLAAAAGVLIWRWAERRLGRVMSGE